MTIWAYPTNITSIYDLANYGNTVTGSAFWGLVLFGLFVIMFFAMKNYPTEKAFGASSFITMITGILLGSIGLLSSHLITLCIVVGAIGVVVLFISNHKDYG